MRKRTILILAAVILLLAGVAGAYLAIGMYYRTHFFEHVTINGINVSDLTAADAEALIAQQAEDYNLTVKAKDGAQETISGADIGYRFVSGGEVQSFLDGQNILMWLPAYFGEGSIYTMDASVTYDTKKLAAAAASLGFMQEDAMVPPQDAKVEQQADGQWVVVPETEGSQLAADTVQALLKQAVGEGRRTVDLEDSGCYNKPAVYADDKSLQAEAAVRNRYSSITVTYQMGGGVTEVLGAEKIAEWFSLDENKQPVFDRDAVSSWVNELADTYDTIGKWLPFMTSNGETVYPESRTYGWMMDREAETEALYQLLMKGESAERAPVWLESAGTRGENDIGDTYVEIDYTNQRMWYYKDGALLVETPVVTGNVSADMASPEGVFCLVGKSEDEVLVGETYRTPVEYWMPFYGGVGIHDADSWRTSYGGDIYKWSGSHGCINTPTAQAAIIYQNIEPGTPVICYSSGTNYGYGQAGSGGGDSGQTAPPENSDIVIIDGGDVQADTGAQTGTDAQGNGAQENADAQSGADGQGTQSQPEDWADESLYYEGQDVITEDEITVY